MPRKARFSRREFVKGIGCASAIGTCSGIFPGMAAVRAASPSMTGCGIRYAYVGSAEDGNHSIQAFVVKGDRWEQIQLVGSRSPSHLLLHLARNLLYVANDVREYQGLPCGTVESYAVDPQNGRLTLVHTQRLSLSGTGPRQLALSPDGKYLVVALYEGGAYNVLALDENGVPARVVGITKELGSGSHPHYQRSAHPSSVCFDPVNGHLLCADLGTDRLSVFAIEKGRLVRKQQLSTSAGMGAAQILLHPSRKSLYLANAFDGSISSYRYLSDTGAIGSQVQQITGSESSYGVAPFLSSLALHPSGRFLYSTSKGEGALSTNVRTWRIDPLSGRVSHVATFQERSLLMQGAAISVFGDRLYLLDRNTSFVYNMMMDVATGKLELVNRVAQVGAPMHLALSFFNS